MLLLQKYNMSSSFLLLLPKKSEGGKGELMTEEEGEALAYGKQQTPWSLSKASEGV